MAAGVVVAVGAVVGEDARVEVAPKMEVEDVMGDGVSSGSLGPAARAVCVAMVLKIDSRGSSVGVATDAEVAERVQVATSNPVRSINRI